MKRSLITYLSILVLIPGIVLAQTPTVKAQQLTTIVALDDKHIITQKEEIAKTYKRGQIIHKVAKVKPHMTDASISNPYQPGTSVGWVAEEKAGLLTSVAGVQNLLTKKQTKSLGNTAANTAVTVVTGIGMTGLASLAMSPVVSGINYVINPGKNYEHVAIFMRSQTSVEQLRSLMFQYAQLSVHGRADRAYYMDALASTFNEYNTQVSKLLGYMLLRANVFKKAGKMAKYEQAVAVEQFIVQATNTCAQEINKIIQTNDQNKLVQLPEIIKQYNESIDNEIQRFLLLEDHAEQRELNPGSGAASSQDEMLKMMLQQM
jgi:hypothetical protein